MARAFQTTFESFVGPPTTALVLLPMAGMSFEAASGLFRSLLILGFALAVGSSALSLPREGRAQGALLGVLFLVTSFSAPSSFGAGQFDAFVACLVGLALLALRRQRPALAGLFLAGAAILKVSPGVLLLYALVRRQYRVAAAGAVALLFIGTGSMVVLPRETLQFAREVAPLLASGSLGMENQSLTGFVARLCHGPVDFTDFRIAAGGFASLAPFIGFLGITGVAWALRSRPFTPAELPLALLVALLAGPLTWTHYVSWGVVFAVTLGESGLWNMSTAPRLAASLATAGWLLLALPVYLLPSRFSPERFFTADAVAAHGAVRLLTGVHTMGLVAWIAAGIILLARTGPLRADAREDETL
jgi:alpha-1,2-mannosyltransferase